MIELTPEYLSKIHLRHGTGTGAADDRCAVQERRAWSGLDPSKDECAPEDCPIITRAVIKLNDRIPDEPTRTAVMLPLMRAMVGTRGSAAVMRRRGYVAADHAVRVFLPMLLERKPIGENLAKRLRALAPLIDRATVDASRGLTSEARKVARDMYADAAAAAAAAYAAYADAAYADAAYADAADAAAAAAYAAAAADAAYAAAAAYAADAAAAAAYAAYAADARRPFYDAAARMILAMCAEKEPTP